MNVTRVLPWLFRLMHRPRRVGWTRLASALLSVIVCAASMDAVAGSAIELSRTQVIFGRLPLQVQSPIQPVFVTNVGDASLTLQSVSISGADVALFKIAGGTCAPPIALLVGGRCRIDLIGIGGFGTNTQMATLDIVSDAAVPAPPVSLVSLPDAGSLYIMPPDPDPDWVDFAPQAVGVSSAPATVVLHNGTGLNLQITTLGLVAGNTTDFALASSCAVGTTFTKGSDCTFTVTFTPSAEGPRSTEIRISLVYLGINGTFTVSLTGVGGGGDVTLVSVVEYYNAALDHYFITWVPQEISDLDSGVHRGWARTGQSFKTYTAAQSGTSPVCRYYIPPGLGDSHFFGRGTAECNATGQRNPSFVLEDPAFMQTFLPVAGVCPPNTIEVYRVFSNRPDANHRYMTDPAIRTQMVAMGWLAEGDGPNLVVMCAPQ